jgi:hypothetical protein
MFFKYFRTTLSNLYNLEKSVEKRCQYHGSNCPLPTRLPGLKIINVNFIDKRTYKI